MKKLASLLLAAAMLFALTACGESPQPAEYNEDIEDAPLSIYFLNAEPEADELWQKLARMYSEQSGVPVTVLSPAQGEYEQVFTQEMDKVKAPVIFQCSRESLRGKENFCYDLSGSGLLNEQLLPLNIVDEEGRTLAVGCSIDTYGLLVNSSLLVKSGHSFEDIASFEGIKAVADDVHARSEELGFDAFIPAGLTADSGSRFYMQLANLPLFYQFRDRHVDIQPEAAGAEYLDCLKNLWDLYITDSGADGASARELSYEQSLRLFAEGKVLFYQGGSEDYKKLLELGTDFGAIEIRALKCGAEGESLAGLSTGTDRYLAVNNECTQEEIQAAEDFLSWLSSSADASAMISEQFGASLFKSAPDYECPLMNKAKSYIVNGFYNIDWAYTMAPGSRWHTDFADALIKYASGSDDWTAVEKVFTEGWAAQYGAEHSGD